jgi:hypothetical protein
MEYESYECGGFNFMIPLSLPSNQPVYEVPISELDRLWKLTAKETYIGVNGGDGEKRFHLACSMGVNSQYPIEIPEIRVDEPDKVCFIDGRHRFSRFRDMHREKILVVVSSKSTGKIENVLSAKRIN